MTTLLLTVGNFENWLSSLGKDSPLELLEFLINSSMEFPFGSWSSIEDWLAWLCDESLFDSCTPNVWLS